MKKVLRCLVVIIFFMFVSMVCYAKEPIKNQKIKSKNATVVNPMYNLSKTKNYYDDYYDDSVYYGQVTDIYELKLKIKEAMENREESVRIDLNDYEGYYKELDFDDLELILQQVLNKNHYIKYSLKSYNLGMDSYYGHFTIYLKADYLTTRYEEEYVDSEVDYILAQIITEDMNDYMKERAIHDYIVNNVAYDQSLVRHSAYNALAEGSTVCQGYALLMCKMLDKVGIESIIVESRPMKHVWNMVCIDKKWYHVDVTWDDPTPDNPHMISYDYYNLTNDEMESEEKGEAHVWDQYSYPIAENKYSSILEDKKVVTKKKGINISTTNAIYLNVKLNQNVAIKKVEMFDGDKLLSESKDIENNIILMPYECKLSDKAYKIKVTVEDGRSCFSDIKIAQTLEIEEVDNKNKVVKIKSLIDGYAHIDGFSRSVKKGQILSIEEKSWIKERWIYIVPDIGQNEECHNALKIK